MTRLGFMNSAAIFAVAFQDIIASSSTAQRPSGKAPFSDEAENDKPKDCAVAGECRVPADSEVLSVTLR